MDNNFIILLAINFLTICYIGWRIGVINAKLQFIIDNAIEGDDR